MLNFLKNISNSNDENKNKKKIENIVFLIIVLIITIIIINIIFKDDTKQNNDGNTNTLSEKKMADNTNEQYYTDLEYKLEDILSTIKNVGKVKVLINYSESSSLIPLYNESTTTSSTEEGDTEGGKRNTTETEVQKDVVFSEKSGNKEPVTQKTIMPTIQGAIVTAEGANDATVKANIINAIGAATGLSIDKIQVFEIEN